LLLALIQPSFEHFHTLAHTPPCSAFIAALVLLLILLGSLSCCTVLTLRYLYIP
jgi:hypothetical protein